jgi:hypothetical protein
MGCDVKGDFAVSAIAARAGCRRRARGARVGANCADRSAAWGRGVGGAFSPASYRRRSNLPDVLVCDMQSA